MSLNFLDFEYPIKELEDKIEALNLIVNKENKFNINLNNEINNLKKECIKITKKIFSNLNSWQICQLSRHPKRPYTLDYIEKIFTDFDELSGDRLYSDDKSIIGGIGRLNGRSVMIIGHQKGRSIEEKLFRNFGMSSPEGYRKSLRLMKIAEKFKLPIITFIDTPGAYPGIKAEERGQSVAIACNISEMCVLKTPIICTIIGEGGSGGALALGVGDIINMLQYSIYSVISPEGCATILWKNLKYSPLAAESMPITSDKLKKLKLIDNIIYEPLGSAYKNINVISNNIKFTLISNLKYLDSLKSDELIKRRYKRLMKYGYN